MASKKVIMFKHLTHLQAKMSTNFIYVLKIFGQIYITKRKVRYPIRTFFLY